MSRLATWQPSDDDFGRVFSDQNPWHTTGSVPDVLAPAHERPLAQELWKALLRPGPVRYPLILGPRRVGKTTTMYQTVRRLHEAGVPLGRLWWLRLDHPLLMRADLGDMLRTAAYDDTYEEPCFVFLDEVVYADDWDLWLKTAYDERWPVRIVATASATAVLAKRHTESGVGRWTEQYLPPYLFSEFLDLVGAAPETPTAQTLADALDTLERAPTASRIDLLRRRFLLLGGFPELLLPEREVGTDDTQHDETRLLHSQRVLRSDAVERAIYKDIPQSFGVDNPMALERLLYVLASQIGGVLSPTGIGKDLGLSQPTFDKYLSYLERAFLVFTLANYSGSEAVAQRRGRKLYFVDGAVRNAALQRGLAPLTDQIELGHLTENLVAANLHALATRAGVRLWYWRDGKHEVDLVFDHPDQPLAIEVGLSPTHSRSGLVEFARRHPRFEGRSWIVAPGAPFQHPRTTSSGVGTVPLDLFLVMVGRQAEQALQQQLGV